MGLAIVVGMLADLLKEDPEGATWLAGSLAVANSMLAAAGLPTHEEPRELPALQSRAGIDSFPYSFLHRLRRAYAYSTRDPAWLATPVADDVDPTGDPVVAEESYLLSSHLLCHSDCEGFYVPVDFEEVLFAEEGEDLPGGMLGSTLRLRGELARVAPALGIALADDGTLGDDEARARRAG